MDGYYFSYHRSSPWSHSIGRPRRSPTRFRGVLSERSGRHDNPESPDPGFTYMSGSQSNRRLYYRRHLSVHRSTPVLGDSVDKESLEEDVSGNYERTRSSTDPDLWGSSRRSRQRSAHNPRVAPHSVGHTGEPRGRLERPGDRTRSRDGYDPSVHETSRVGVSGWGSVRTCGSGRDWVRLLTPSSRRTSHEWTLLLVVERRTLQVPLPPLVVPVLGVPGLLPTQQEPPDSPPLVVPTPWTDDKGRGRSWVEQGRP